MIFWLVQCRVVVRSGLEAICAIVLAIAALIGYCQISSQAAHAATDAQPATAAPKIMTMSTKSAALAAKRAAAAAAKSAAIAAKSAAAAKNAAARRQRDFVTRRDNEFFVRGTKFRVAGVNNHYLPWGSKQEVTRVLDDAVAMHANVVRTFIAPIIGSTDGSAPTIWNWQSKSDSSNLGVNGAYMAAWDPTRKSIAVNVGPDGLGRIDFLINEASKRKLRLIIAFLDYWAYTGGAPQMNAWRGGGKDDHSFAESAQSQADYKELVRTVVTRVNSLSGVAYKDDPTIMAWELMNEPDIHPTSLFLSWVGEMAAYVKSIDPNHLLASGSGSIQTKLVELQTPAIDFGTWHGYPAYEHVAPENYSAEITDYCGLAKGYGKPVILEEFGVAASNADRPQIYRQWLTTVQSNPICAGWLVWRLVARQDNGQFPVDDHDQFDIHNDASPVWLVLKNAALAMTTPSSSHVAHERVR
jgi:mannan endo-1,4-beta-mannosidase